MVHGRANMSSPCMKDRKCEKFFPKKFKDTTTIDDEGYPKYRRGNHGFKVEKLGVEMDNRNVVPYNTYLLMRYQAHINVEFCNKSNSIKYLFKYVNKGPDRAAVEIFNRGQGEDNSEVVDEIKQYYDCRYFSILNHTVYFSILACFSYVNRIFFTFYFIYKPITNFQI